MKKVESKNDWSKHEFKHECLSGELGEVKIFELSQPNTNIHRVRLTVSDGCTLVTGDLYRWSFRYDLSPIACKNPCIGEQYLAGKLSQGSGAVSWNRYDPQGTEGNIKEILSQADEYEDDYIKDIRGLLNHIEDGEIAMLSAIEESVYSYEIHDSGIVAYDYDPCFFMVIDAVREMCRRLWNESKCNNK
jgi:hypothetical protein